MKKSTLHSFVYSTYKAAFTQILFFYTWVSVHAAPPGLPSIGPNQGVTAESDPADILVTVFQWAGGVAIWLAVAWFGLQMFGDVIKAANEARAGDSTWAEAAKSMVGNVLVFVLFLGLAVWYSAAFLASS
jgi:hypothetical protein